MQSGILPGVPAQSRYMEFDLVADADAAAVLQQLAALPADDSLVWGIGPAVAALLDVDIPGLEAFPAISGKGVNVPSSQGDLWCWLRGDDRGALALQGRSLAQLLGPAFDVARIVDGFKYADGRDLSGYVDGTENPDGEQAIAAAFADNGSSIVAVQQWLHDLDHLDSMPIADQDNLIGRRKSDNVEFPDSPAFAHTRRSGGVKGAGASQVLRRSSPWADSDGEGLMFVSFGRDKAAFEAQLYNMAGGDDGIVDGVFRFSRPITGSYYWCPPVKDGRIDLSVIGL